jgi:hypothetical protein
LFQHGQTLCVAAEVPDDVMIDDLMAHPPPNWRALGSPEAVAAGDEWIASGGTPASSGAVGADPKGAELPRQSGPPRRKTHRGGAPEKPEWDAGLFGVPSAT